VPTGRFDFVGGDDFRDSLESDYEELEQCLQAGAWKAVHVLAGSIVEAVLVDYLASTGFKKKDPLKLELGEAITEANSAGIVSQKTADLSNVVREYRNLIHPGRVIRLGESVDDSGAVVAKSLVDMVIKEVSRKKAKEYGYTAEQLLRKIKSDPKNSIVIGHLVTEVSPVELERLLLSVLPSEFADWIFEDEEAEDHHLRRAVQLRYGEAFKATTDVTREKATKNFVRIVKKGSEHQIKNYEQLFCTGVEARYATASDRGLLVNHFVATQSQRPSVPVARAVQGSVEWIPDSEADRIANLVGEALRDSGDSETDIATVKMAEAYYKALSDEKSQSVFRERLERWQKIFERTRREMDADTLGRLLESIRWVDLEDLPF